MTVHVAKDRAAEPAERGEISGRKPRNLTAARAGIYLFLVVLAAFFVFPLYVMIVTSLKTMDEIRVTSMLAWPAEPTLRPWFEAWSSACTGVRCEGIRIGFLNSVKILVPGVLAATLLGAINGYALAFWRVRGAELLFAGLVIGAFIPVQVFIYPLVRILSTARLNNSLTAIVLIHMAFQMPIVTLIFRNYFSSIPVEIFKAARVDGAGFFRTFWSIILPMSSPIIIVAVILLTTNIWNDFILGLIFAGRENLPMTVQLNNLVNSAEGSGRDYGVEMAAVALTTLVPLVVYFASGRWFVQGIASGAVKG
jgi:glucose/mannose transport system permease protein